MNKAMTYFLCVFGSSNNVWSILDAEKLFIKERMTGSREQRKKVRERSRGSVALKKKSLG